MGKRKFELTPETEELLNGLEEVLRLDSKLKTHHNQIQSFIDDFRNPEVMISAPEQEALNIKRCLSIYTNIADVDDISTASTFYRLYRNLSDILREGNLTMPVEDDD